MAGETSRGPVSRLGWIAYAIAAAVIAIDQAVKGWIIEGFLLPLRGSVPVVWPLSFSYVQNNGVSFGMMQADADLVRWALTAFSVAVAIALIDWARRPDRVLLGTGLGLIIGGAIGNAIDRFAYGAVADFVRFHITTESIQFSWAVFNVADAAIVVGVAFLLYETLWGVPKKRPDHRQDGGDGDAAIAP
jgi:signal peptidase II